MLHLNIIIPVLLFLVLLGYLLKWWYQVSYSMYVTMVLLVVFLLGFGYLVLEKHGLSPYLVGGIILVAYIFTRWYNISWRDLADRFRSTSKPT